MTRANIIQAGDLVRLAAGGPTLVVESLFGDDDAQRATCSWFDKRRVLHTQRIKVSALDLVHSPP